MHFLEMNENHKRRKNCVMEKDEWLEKLQYRLQTYCLSALKTILFNINQAVELSFPLFVKLLWHGNVTSFRNRN